MIIPIPSRIFHPRFWHSLSIASQEMNNQAIRDSGKKNVSIQSIIDLLRCFLVIVTNLMLCASIKDRKTLLNYPRIDYVLSIGEGAGYVSPNKNAASSPGDTHIHIHTYSHHRTFCSAVRRDGISFFAAILRQRKPCLFTGKKRSRAKKEQLKLVMLQVGRKRLTGYKLKTCPSLSSAIICPVGFLKQA